MTPQEWFEGLAAQRDSQKAALRAAWQEQCDAIAARKREAAAAQQRAENDMQWARTQQQFERAERAQREAAAALREALAEQVGGPATPTPQAAAAHYSIALNAKGGKGVWWVAAAAQLPNSQPCLTG